MNYSIIRYTLGCVLKLEAALLLLPSLTAAIYRETEGLYYIAVAAACALLGFIISFKKPKSNVFYLKEGCVATALSWIVLSLFGCLPFILSGEIPRFTDALFEIVSGFTTTGASILSDVESLSHCALIWRSFSHWIGGMGVLVFLLAIVPLSGGSHFNLMRAESPGPAVGKLVPRLKHTARILYIIYVALTALEIILLFAGGMPAFDSFALSFGTAGTGGFGIRNDSLGSYTAYQQWVVTIFMLLFGVNFNAYYFIIFRQFRKLISMEEVRWYFIIVFGAAGILMVDLVHRFGNFFTALRHALFQVAAVITTTGYSTADFDKWSQTSRFVLVMLMFVGACAGSTGGGIKVSRFMIAIKTVGKELESYLHPKSVRKIKMDGKPVEHEVVRSVNVYFITFLIIFISSVFILSFEGKDAESNFTAVASALNNIGPGLGIVGPMGNFGSYGDLSKLVMIFDMLAGRLELFPLLILFRPAVWKRH